MNLITVKIRTSAIDAEVFLVFLKQIYILSLSTGCNPQSLCLELTTNAIFEITFKVISCIKERTLEILFGLRSLQTRSHISTIYRLHFCQDSP